MLKAIPRDYFDPSKGTLKLLWEEEWRGLGITQVCYASAGNTTYLLTYWYRAWAGSTMRYTSRSHTSYFSSAFLSP